MVWHLGFTISFIDSQGTSSQVSEIPWQKSKITQAYLVFEVDTNMYQ